MKAILQKQRRDKDFPKQTKAEGVNYHKTCLTKNARSSLPPDLPYKKCQREAFEWK